MTTKQYLLFKKIWVIKNAIDDRKFTNGVCKRRKLAIKNTIKYLSNIILFEIKRENYKYDYKYRPDGIFPDSFEVKKALQKKFPFLEVTLEKEKDYNEHDGFYEYLHLIFKEKENIR